MFGKISQVLPVFILTASLRGVGFFIEKMPILDTNNKNVSVDTKFPFIKCISIRACLFYVMLTIYR
jgi:hypothetical protein